MTIVEYLIKVTALYKSGIATEHSYRGDLLRLIEFIVPSIEITNEPARIECGAPDYILSKGTIPVGYIEAKDIGKDLGNKEYKNQFDRYLKSLDNLIITDYLLFKFYVDGQLIAQVRIADVIGHEIKPLPSNFEQFNSLIRNFCTYTGQTIRSAAKLATMMADKARLLSQIIDSALTSDVVNDENSSLKQQMFAFKEILIHDIKPPEFADIYAQTIAYGMFAARLHDPTLQTFSRQEAAELIPQTNPFLRRLFQYVAGYDLDPRVIWIVDALADIFRATDVASILKNFGRSTRTTDPIIHFYETFLTEYNPKLKKKRGVWYTPEPVVKFIVKAVDDLLQTEFNLPDGLADSSKIKVKLKAVTKATSDQRSKVKEVEVEKEVHKVQILDPATGTGTFLAEVVKQIYSKFEGQRGIWSSYAENHLIPRLNGFEILMASYAMAHLKLDMLLTETGFKNTRQERFKIYLTNSLEEYHKDTDTLFANWLSSEANEANHIKRDSPVMVIVGNPPYNGESANKGDWIMGLMKDYKMEPGGLEKLKEKNSKWLNNDYVKFLRYGQYFIEKNNEGILAFINPHGFLDDPTFRGMRWHLLKTYDKIYTIDLHGNSKKSEVSPDGSADVNVFDILPGVSINIFVKTGLKKEDQLAEIFHHEIYGKREIKYEFLLNNTLAGIPFTKVTSTSPNYFFITKKTGDDSEYNQFFKVSELFNVGNSGVVSKRDKLNIHFTKDSVAQMIQDFNHLEEAIVKSKYSIPDDVRDWNFYLAKKDLHDSKSDLNLIHSINYRPFDKRFFYYTGKSKGIVGWPVPVVSNHLKRADNFGLMLNKKIEVGDFAHALIYKGIVESHAVSMKEINYVFPLYLYPNESSQLAVDDLTGRLPNLNMQIVRAFEDRLDLTFTPEKTDQNNCFSPIDLLDYIYAVLYNPTYRRTYNELLKIDFPRVPFPSDNKTFLNRVENGRRLRLAHLFEGPRTLDFKISYPVDGDNLVNDLHYIDEKVYINATQYFDNVPLSIWLFTIGGYKPAKKWLSERKGRTLKFEDIRHYQSIIQALYQTQKIMSEMGNEDPID